MKEICFMLMFFASISVHAQECMKVLFVVEGDDAIKGEVVDCVLPENSVRISFMDGFNMSNVAVLFDSEYVYSGLVSSDTLFGTGRALSKIFPTNGASMMSVVIEGQSIQHNLIPGYNFISIEIFDSAITVYIRTKATAVY